MPRGAVTVRSLRGFEKVALKAGISRRVQFPLTKPDGACIEA
jgi:hypothetical protein